MASKKVVCENLPTINTSKLIHGSLEVGAIKRNLEEIQPTWSQTNWTVVPSATPHIIEETESMAMATKRSLCYLPTSLSPILEFDVVFKSIAIIINNRTTYYTNGRFGRTSVQSLYGISELPVLHNSTRLALLIMREVHQGQDGVNHCKSPSDMIRRSWQYAFIYKPYSLALQVARDCP